MVDKDLTMGQAICDSLLDDVTDTCCMTSAIEALADYMKNEYCLVILDIQSADTNNIELLRTIRNTKHTPILVLTDSLSPEDTITLFHAGADACLEKPVNISVCVAQAHALIQLYFDSDSRYENHSAISFGSELIISPRYRQVMVDGKNLDLTRKEFDLLHCLASYPRQVFTREQLYDHVWGDGAVGTVDDVVKSLVKRLRKKLSQIGKDYIRNEWGVGYKFVLSDC